MRSEDVEFFSSGFKLTAEWHLPDDPSARVGAVVQGPGWMGLGDAAVYRRYHEAITAAGFGILSINYRGFGGSEGEPSLASQADDLSNAVSYLCARDDVETTAIGAFATGGTGGGNVVLLAARDPRVRAVVSQFPVADGENWLRRMRSEDDWLLFRQQLERDREQRATAGDGARVKASEIVIPASARAKRKFKSDVDARVPATVSLSIADELLRYHPAREALGLTTPIMLIGVEEDTTTPIEHARQIFDVVRGPKVLIVQTGVDHYEAYERYADQVIPRIVEFFRSHLTPRQELFVLGGEGVE